MKKLVEQDFVLLAMIAVVTGLSDTSSAQMLPANVRVVNAEASDCGDGITWDTAYKYLQDAIFEASNPPFQVTQIWVKAGTYYPDRDCANPDGTCDPGPCAVEASFVMHPGVTLYGGFAGGETDVDQRNVGLNETILSGDLEENDTPMDPFNGQNSWHVLTFMGDISSVNETAVVDGFTITGGDAKGPQDPHQDDSGGGARLLKNIVPVVEPSVKGPTFDNCRFVRNRARFFGGAVGGRNIGATLRNCVFESNEADNSPLGTVHLPLNGGGAVSTTGPTDVVRCDFFQNRSDNGRGGALENVGGGIWSGSLTVTSGRTSRTMKEVGQPYLREQGTSSTAFSPATGRTGPSIRMGAA